VARSVAITLSEQTRSRILSDLNGRVAAMGGVPSPAIGCSLRGEGPAHSKAASTARRRTATGLFNPRLDTRGAQLSLKLLLTLNTALTIANAMNPTRMKTIRSTALAITLVKMFSWPVTIF